MLQICVYKVTSREIYTQIQFKEVRSIIINNLQITFMSDSKVFMFPETGTHNSELMSIISPLLSQRGLDPNLLLTMNRNNGFFGNDGSWFMWFLFIFFLVGGNGFGGFNRGVGQVGAELGNLINNDNGRELLMSAIQGNGNAINHLASTINCDVNSIKAALNGVMSQIQGVGNQVGMSSQQIINAIQAGNCQIASQLAKCCCDNQLAICQQTNTLQNAINGVSIGQERGFSSVAYETQKQTCDIQNSIKSAADAILAGQKDAEMREMQNKIDMLRESNSQKDVIINNGQQTALFSQMIQSATAPIANAVTSLQGDINGIKCKLPETVTLPYSCATAVPTQAVYNSYALGALGAYSNLGCNNSLWG